MTSHQLQTRKLCSDVGRAADALSRHVFEPDTELLNLGKGTDAKRDREALVWILGVTRMKLPATTRLRMIREKITRL